MSFLIINIVIFTLHILILYNDIMKRKIPSMYLYILLAIFPLWLYEIPYSFNQESLILFSVLSSIIIVFGVLFHGSKHSIIGGGDIKYFSLLILYSIGFSLANLMLNIGYAILLLLAFVLGNIFHIFWILRKHLPSIEKTRKNIFSIKKSDLIDFVLYWIIFGYGVFITAKIIFAKILEWYPGSHDGNLYFLVILGLYSMRIYIKKFFQLQNPIGILILILLFIAGVIEKSGGWLVHRYTFIEFFISILPIAIAIISISSIMRGIFHYSEVAEGDFGKNIFPKHLPFSIPLAIGYYMTLGETLGYITI